MRGRATLRDAGAVRRTLLVLLALTLVAGGGWWWSQRPGPDLEALREDPLASWVPAGATLERGHEARSGTTLGKPRYARVTRVFTLEDREPDAVLDEARAVASNAGWRIDRRSDDALTATRDEPDWRLELTVVTGTYEGVPGDLFVYLTAYPASPVSGS